MAARGGRSTAGERRTAGGRDDRRATLDALRRLVQALRAGARGTTGRAGLTSAELFVLRALAEGGPAHSLNELAARTFTDQSSASPVVERLRQRGLVARERSATDRRRVTITLTRAGRAAVRRSVPPPQVMLLSALERLSAQEREHLARGLESLVEAMGLSHRKAAMLFERPARR